MPRYYHGFELGVTTRRIAASFDRCSASQLEATGLKGFFRSGSLWSRVLGA